MADGTPKVLLAVEEVTPAAARSASALLSDGERARVAAIRRPERAAAVAVSLALARRVLADATGRAPAALVFCRACHRCGDPDHGRPRLVPGGVEFSVSRSERWAAVAVAPVPVGVDVEDPGRPVTADDLAPVLSAAERRWATGRGGDDLLRLWVMKEAAGKAAGLGIVDADGLPVVTGHDDGLDGWRPVTGAPGGDWCVARVDAPGAVLAVAVAGEPLPVHRVG